MRSNFLVYWKDMMKDSDEPLPMRPFDSKEQAEAYVMGCADVICVSSKEELDSEVVMKDFIISQSQ